MPLATTPPADEARPAAQMHFAVPVPKPIEPIAPVSPPAILSRRPPLGSLHLPGRIVPPLALEHARIAGQCERATAIPYTATLACPPFALVHVPIGIGVPHSATGEHPIDPLPNQKIAVGEGQPAIRAAAQAAHQLAIEDSRQPRAWKSLCHRPTSGRQGLFRDDTAVLGASHTHLARYIPSLAQAPLAANHVPICTRQCALAMANAAPMLAHIFATIGSSALALPTEEGPRGVATGAPLDVQAQ
mmetsp:Transcript_31596/g.96701  ORF Transcript_31596/g.96701 Transcript_31596/m.96701 type:complete len:245 (-) Transcript_31596:1412-2146(-)|eukprot:scaffold119636_cov30-Tisochrysis_lutea.AAC.2